MTFTFRVNPIACTGHGMCAELLPEVIELDRWGYPILASPKVPRSLLNHARRAAWVTAERAAFWWPLAEDQDRRMTVEVAPGPVPVFVAADDLATCADILLGNVFAHTPEGVAFAVRLSRRAAGGAWLVVADDGPGFGDADAARRGQSSRGSTGLGLDIARLHRSRPSLSFR